jgi:hypothetical protein
MPFRSRASFRRILLAVSLGLVVTAAMFGASSIADAKRGRAGKAKAPATAAACKIDKDCVAVVDDCCPCNEGGRQHAIPKKDQAAYEKDRHKRCQGTMCAEVVSQDPSCSQVAICGAGLCELGEPGGEAAP